MVLNGNIYEVYGVTSYGAGCADPNFPGIYGDVWQVKDWITDTMTHNDCNYGFFRTVERASERVVTSLERIFDILRNARTGWLSRILA